MQSKTAWPREHLTVEQVDMLLTNQGVERDHGLEVLDEDNRVVEDISSDCQPWTVTHSGTAQIHGELSVDLARALDWGRVRVRPYMDLRLGSIEGRFYAGGYVLTRPNTEHGREPLLYKATGPDLLHLLNRQVGDTYRLGDPIDGAAPTYLDALRQLVTDAGLTISVRLDGTRQDAVLPKPRVWALGQTKWLDIANDLLSEVAYTDLFCDEVGGYRAQPVTAVEQRAVEHVFDTRDEHTDLIDASITESQNQQGTFNAWRFARADMDTSPADGAGLFTVPPPDGTPTAEIRWAPLRTLNVADQAALEAEALRIVAADQRVEHSFDIKTDPLPIAGHRDVVQVVLANGSQHKMQVTSWQLTPYGKSPWTLGGGAGGGERERNESSTKGTVTSGSSDPDGLRVVVDGATVHSVAVALADDSGSTPTFAVGDRVNVTIRNPLPPLIEGIETS